MRRLPPSHFDYHSLHVADPQADAVRVKWSPSFPRADRLRVREHTCICTFPMFELCTAAGLWFVRRIPDESSTGIVESPWMSAPAARDLWLQVVTGQAE
ncbi:hypothetical protein [Nonomuraea sp. 10N515B]|uniref:hypothetical protein n=1 Tax=Nonomuraea sp. 10N515B TaxID=3457422 RepID=UPI003FCDCBC3